MRAIAAWIASLLVVIGAGVGVEAGLGVGATVHSLARPTARATIGSCGALPPRHAFVVAVASGGTRAWTTLLRTNDDIAGTSLAPIVEGGTGYFAQDNAIYALRLSDGRQIWSWTSSGDVIYGTWASGDVLAVLTDQVSTHALLTGLDMRTGAVTWQLPIPGRGLVGSQAATTDGGLAWTLAGSEDLQVVNLADGKVLWSVPIPQQSSPVAADGLVLSAQNGVLTAFDDRSGVRRWSVGGLPTSAAVEVEDGLVLLTSGTQGPAFPTVLDAVGPLSGKVAWRFDPRVANYGIPGGVTVLSAGPAGLLVSTYDPRILYLLAPRSGRPRWSADTFVDQNAAPAVLVDKVVSVEGGVTDSPPLSLVERGAVDGRSLWSVRLGDLGGPVGDQQVVVSGSSVVIAATTGRLGQTDRLAAFDLGSGRRLWQAVLPTFTETSPVPVAGHFVVQSADPGTVCPIGG
jgi:outer membrane protein assembly factor BamB